MLDSIFKFDVEFNPDGSGEQHLGRRHIYRNGPIFRLGYGDGPAQSKCIKLVNCVVELDLDGNLDRFRASVFAEGFSPDCPRVLMGVYENAMWKYDSFRDIYSNLEEERQAQISAIKTVVNRTKKPFIEAVRFLAKFVIERHARVSDRSEEERRQKERREQQKLERRMAQLRDELERLRGGKPVGESRLLLRMLVNEAIDGFLFENMMRDAVLGENGLRNMIRGVIKSTLNESHLYTGDINADDLRVNAHWTDDGYAEWEAFVDNGWYTFRGTYDGVDCELDEIIQGHSGYGHQIEIDDKALDWFNNNLRDRIARWVENYADDFDTWMEKYGNDF